VIGRFGEQAPESHLDAGLIYFQRVKDPFKGWYYLQRYLELQPASPRRDEIRQQVTAAEREMIFQRLAQAQFGGGELVQLQEQVDQLTRENARLEAELKMIREAPSGVVTRSEIMLAPVTNASAPIAVGPAAGSASPSGQINLSPTAAVPQAAIVMSPPGAAKSTPPAEPKGTTATQKGAPANAQKTAPAATKGSPAAVRTHTVRSGENLSSIARQYYNGDQSAARIKALTEANRDVLKNGTSLSIGMTLRIP
jgi:nucleoid-associated protein YgaU